MTIILEAGPWPRIEHMPLSIADPRASHCAATLGTMVDAFGTIACRGFCTLGVVGAAECDEYGNLNATSLGGYLPAALSETGRGPNVRLTGSGGANDIAGLADKMVAMMVHEKRRFPRRVGYLTTPAGMRGPAGETRFDFGLYRGGELCVISDLCKMRPSTTTGKLVVTDIFPGVTLEQIRANTGWDIDCSEARPFSPPTWEELYTLRMEVDPARIYLDRKKKA
jgi:glutaconate CoA-transferase subunit B